MGKYSQAVMDRVMDVCLLTAETSGTVRETGIVMDMPKSTVHHDIVVKMPEINRMFPDLEREEVANEARAVLLRHKRHLSVVSPQNLFRFEAFNTNADKKEANVFSIMPSKTPAVTVYIVADGIEEALVKLKGAGLMARRDRPIVEFPACRNLRKNCHNEFFCGDGDEEGIKKCHLDKDEMKYDICPHACKNFWKLVNQEENREFVAIPGAMRIKRLKSDLTRSPEI